jgi:hypothetical protein
MLPTLAILAPSSSALRDVFEPRALTPVHCSRGGKAIRMTDEHKPNHPDEVTRLKAVRGPLFVSQGGVTRSQLGAFISDDGVTQRVNGMIGITRALGDHMMKELIINDPHLYATELQPEDKFVILACDGVRAATQFSFFFPPDETKTRFGTSSLIRRPWTC